MSANNSDNQQLSIVNHEAMAWEPSVIDGAYNRLTPQQKTASTLIAAGVSVSDTASQIQVGLQTVWRWLRNPDFLLVVNARRSEVWEQTRAKMLDLTSKAVEYLGDVLADDDAPRRDRLRAAELILRAYGDRYNRTKITTDPVEIEAQIMEQ